ncbi:MAG: hypothetical protein ACYC4Q_07520 [Victivallaceae bacterium]
MNHKYYFVYGRKSGNQLTKAVRYRKLAVKTCARMNGVILPGNASRRPVEAMPLFPDWEEQLTAADQPRRKRQYAVGWFQLESREARSFPPKVKLAGELLPFGLDWMLEN